MFSLYFVLWINEIKNLTKLISEIDIKDISDESTFAGKKYDLPSNKYFILHHTAGRGDAHRIVKILNNRFKGGLGVQYVIDREGNIYRTLPLGARGAHILNSRLGPNNSNSQGVEVIGNNDDDILPVQAVAALQLVKHLGFKPSQLYGHGEVNPGHRSPSEGITIKNFITANYNETDPEEYDFSMFKGKDSEIEAAKQMKCRRQRKRPSISRIKLGSEDTRRTLLLINFPNMADDRDPNRLSIGTRYRDLKR